MKNYVTAWLIGTLAFLAIVVAINVAVDPYGILGMPRIAGFNRDKVAAADWPRMVKPYLVGRADPKTILLGTSSSDVGYDASSPDWPDEYRPMFNLAIDGALVDQLYRYEQHALAVSHPKLVVINISLEDSQVFEDTPHGPYDFDERLTVRADGSPNPGLQVGIFKDYLFAVGSFRALGDSIDTVLAQHNPLKTYETPLGFLDAGKFVSWAKDDGFYALASDKDHLHAGMDIRWARKKMSGIDPLADMIKLARGHGAKVIVVIIPSYADQMEIRRQTGIGDAFDAWKRRVVEITDSTNAALGDVTLWDFGGFSRYTTEQLPAQDDHATRLKWFWESIHFQPALGNLIVQRLMGKGPEDFGVKLTAANLQADIDAYHQGQEAWVADHPKDVARITRFIAEAYCTDNPAACANGIVSPPPAAPATAEKIGSR